MLCLENGGGTCSTIVKHWGLKCWNKSTEVGGIWTRQEEIIKILFGGGTYVLFAIL